MKNLYNKKYQNSLLESLLDDEEELSKNVDDEVTGLKPALRCLEKNKYKIKNKFFDKLSKIGDDVDIFITNPQQEICNFLNIHEINIEDFLCYFVKILCKYGAKMFETTKSKSMSGFDPKYHKGITPFDKDDFKRWNIKEYDNAIEWTAWANSFTPWKTCMLKSIKEMDKDELKFMSEFFKILK